MPTTPSTTLNRRNLFADLGYSPHDGQWPMHESAARFRVMACGTRGGKTTSAAHEAIALSLEPKDRAVGWVCAPTYDLADKVFREIVYVFQSRLPQLVETHRAHEHLLRVWNLAGGLCEIRRKSADSQDSLIGEGLDWLVLDEAARVKPDTWERHLMARLLDKKGRGIIISTPKGKGWFYDAWRSGQRKELGYESWNWPTWMNPIISRDEIDRIRQSVPEMIFRQEYGAEFIDGAGSVFRKVREAATGEWSEPLASETYHAGLDLAKVEDYTVLVIMDSNRRVVFCDRFNREDWSIQVGRIAATCERYGHPLVYVDSTGVGDPVLESLLASGVSAEGYKFTRASKKALVDNLAIMLERGEITLPRREIWPEGIEELEDFQYSISGDSLKMEAPSGRHDDIVIATCLAAWGLRYEDDFELTYLD